MIALITKPLNLFYNPNQLCFAVINIGVWVYHVQKDVIGKPIENEVIRLFQQTINMENYVLKYELWTEEQFKRFMLEIL